MSRMTRREFVASTALAGAAFCIAPRTARAARRSANDKLNIAVIGCGGRGAGNLSAVAEENIIALCDVDEDRAAGAFASFPQAKKYHDFRKLLEHEQNVDAVVIATPDHTHAPAAVMAMKLGKHVYCEKPLTHSIYEARRMRDAAREMKVATQMGIQGHAMDGQRRAGELLRAGAIGPVREVHAWTDRPGRFWPQPVDRPDDTPAVPDHLKWDLWLGPAPERPYHPAYAPFNWRGFWDFGTGALGDMACHVCDLAFWALELESPTTVEAESSEVHPESPPAWSIIHYDFPARGERPAVRLTWYDGGKKPSDELVGGQDLPDNGMILVGDAGTMFCTTPYGEEFTLLPEDKYADVEGPEPTIPRSPGHHQEWLAACRGGPPALANFDYAAPMTEALLLGNVALRLGHKIEWDTAELKVTNAPEAEAEPLIRRAYRAGWEL